MSALDVDITNAYRRQQSAIAAEVMRGVMQVWQHVDPRDVDRAWPVVSEALGQVVTAGHAKATAAGAAYMTAHARANGAEPVIKAAAALPAEQVATSLKVTGPVAVKVAARAGMSADVAGRAAMSQAMGASSRLALMGARVTIKQSAEATDGYRAWMRQASTDACQYCQEHSGVVFMLGDSEGDEFFAFHDHCYCSIVPVASGTASSVSSATYVDTRTDVDAADVSAVAEGTGAGESAASSEALTGLSDDELSALLAGDGDITPVLAELDRRDALEQAAKVDEARKAKAAAYAREHRAQQKADRIAAADAEVDRLVASGVDPEEAFAQAHGTTVERLRRDDAIRRLRDEGYKGANFDRLSANAWRDERERLMLAAEDNDITRGYTVSRKGIERGVTLRDLYTKSDAFARRWASQELRTYWDETGGRPTLDEFRANLLTGSRGAREKIEDYHQ